MPNSAKTKEVLRWYAGEQAGVLTHLAQMLEHGRMAGSGKLVVLPVDQGFEHGPARSFACQPIGYDPQEHARLAIDSGCSAHAAPLGALEIVAGNMPGEIPLILKLNNSESLSAKDDPSPAWTASVDDALRLGCAAIGLTLYPGSRHSKSMYEAARDVIAEAKSKGLVSVVWAYPRGTGLSKAGEQAIDVVSYAAHIGCQLGAHIIKVKPPTAHLEQPEAAKIFAQHKIDTSSLEARVRHVMQACFAGRRLVLFSGGASKGEAAVLEDVRALARGGASGSILGRNAFQRPRAEGIALLHKVMDAFGAAAPA